MEGGEGFGPIANPWVSGTEIGNMRVNREREGCCSQTELRMRRLS